MNIIKKTIATLAIMAVTAGFAQDSKTTISGNADFYYRFDFANGGSAVQNNKTSFTNSNDSFELGMATVKANHKEGKAAIFADLGFGTRSAEFSSNDKADAQFFVKQLNMTYDLSDKFKITAGAFATHLGYELVDAVDNKNYSMSYAFTNGPFFNTGVKGQYTSGKFSIMGGITNPTDFKTAAQAGSNQKAFIGQVGYTADSGTIFLNFTAESRNPAAAVNKRQIDVVATKKVNDNITLGFNGTFATSTPDAGGDDKNWFSAIIYAQYGWSKESSLAYRFEYLGDKDGLITAAADNSIIANTLSFNFKEGKFTFIPEVRFDLSSKDIFKDKDLKPQGSAASILFATTYSF